MTPEKQSEMIQNNKLIMAFMNVKPKLYGDQYQWNDGVFFSCRGKDKNYVLDSIANYLKYSTSWDWIMPVIVKIGQDTGYTLVMEENSSYWVNSGDYGCDNTEFGGYSDIENIYTAVVEFIKWNNLKIKSNEN